MMRRAFFFLFLFSASVGILITNQTVATPPLNHSYKKLQAFEVLEKKCNACHLKDKPNYFFTLDNMERFAKKINKQVFVKKKMPKGKEDNLTEKEEQALKAWVNDELNKK